MLITRGSPKRSQRPVALTIGNFDGVHRGHQAMLARVVDAAHARGLVPMVLTFEPHPREVLAPLAAPTRLTSLREKLELLQSHDIARVHVQRFSRSFASLSPVAFIEGTLMAGLDARWLLVGEDFRFGAKRAGDFAMLERAAAAHGVALEAMPSVRYEGTRISSSAVRAALAGGDLARARALLGRSYSISGRVVHGDKLGRELGFATANVQLKHNRPPLTGIFAVRVRGVRSTVCKGIASLGFRPTVKSDGRATLEVHLFDFSDELYGAHLQVEFIAKIRDEEKYADLATLRAQIARDCEVARTLHSQHA